MLSCLENHSKENHAATTCTTENNIPLNVMIYDYLSKNPKLYEMSREKQWNAFKTAFPQIQPVSLKRFKKIYASSASLSSKLKDGSVAFPEINSMVKCKLVPSMGKGLFAESDIDEQNSFLFEENPLVFFPTWKWKIHFEEKEGMEICSSCAKPLLSGAKGSVLIRSCKDCNTKFCSKDCLNNAMERGHTIECPKHCPEIKELYQYARSIEYSNVIGCLKIICHALHCPDDLDVYDSFARISEAERLDHQHNKNPSEEAKSENDFLGLIWRKCYDLMVKALVAKHGESKAFKKFLGSFESFLELLGLWSVNSLGGGLYVAQSCLNHSCQPNVIVENPMPRSEYRILVRAIKPILKGEQLFMSYVHPDLETAERQEILAKSYHFKCRCGSCSLNPTILS